MTNGKRGFGSMDPAKQREIASRGGKLAHSSGRAHEFTSEEARRAGAKGGAKVSANRAHMQAIGRKGGRAVASMPGHMSAIGKKGGAAVSQRPGHMAAIGALGGAVVSANASHMADIGKKGGEARAR